VQAALATIWISVALGAALAISQRFTRGVTGPIRTFAVVAAALVVGLSLLPHAIASEGVWGVVGAVAGFAAIPGAERLIRAFFQGLGARSIRLEVGYAGLLVHRFGDGVAMSVDGHGHDVLLALGAHEIPIVALVTLAYLPRGLAHALVRVVALGLASSIGCWVVRAMPAPAWHGLHGWADAIAAGILLHIVSHELASERLETVRDRALDVLGGAVALLIVCVSGGEHADEQGLGGWLLEAALTVAPALSLGLICTAALLATGARLPRAWRFRNRHPTRSGLAEAAHLSPERTGTGSARSSIHPPPGQSLLQRMATVDSRPENLAISLRLLGFRLTLLRLVGAFALATCVGLFQLGTHKLAPPPVAAAGKPLPAEEESRGSWLQRFWSALESSLLDVGAWLGFGLLAAGYLSAFVPPDGLGGPLGPMSRLLFIAALALAAYLCPVAATPIAAALLSKGLPASTCLVGLLLGGASHSSGLSHSIGWRARLLMFAVLALASVGLAGWLDTILGTFSPAALPGARSTGLEWLCLVLLGLVLGRNLWRLGIRGWFEAGFYKPHQHLLPEETELQPASVPLAMPPR
jgi:uncharacterized protein